MKTVKTGASCPYCKRGDIVAEVEVSSPPLSTSGTMIGPGSGRFNSGGDETVTFHCDDRDCQLLFHLPPGKPNAVNEAIALARRQR